jgi:tripeptide aminopeptidase
LLKLISFDQIADFPYSFVMKMEILKPWFEKRLQNRFLRYVRLETTSDKHAKAIPSTKGQLKFGKMLAKELKSLGIPEVKIDEHGFVCAFLPASSMSLKEKTIGFLAHLDTSPDVTAKNVNPIVHENYNGKTLVLKQGKQINPNRFPELKDHLHQTIITSDGTTLLGADDKAGVAEIMTALEFLTTHPEFKHGNIEIIFTPDEETGKGMSKFPLKNLKSPVCFTIDGGEEGAIEVECFEAYSLKVSFNGQSIHLGEAREKLVNAVELASLFVSMLPKNESPQATDKRFGYYAGVELHATIERAEIEVLIRDFKPQECQRRIKAVKTLVNTLLALYPGAQGQVQVRKQYSNMWPSLKSYPKLIVILEEAVRRAGAAPKCKYIRGGTDGARLSEMGVRTPNIFTGGHNFHSQLEWIALPAMVKATLTIINLIELWVLK